MQYYAVIDTNVLVSAMLKFQSIPGQIVKEALLGTVIPLLCDEIVANIGRFWHGLNLNLIRKR